PAKLRAAPPAAARGRRPGELSVPAPLPRSQGPLEKRQRGLNVDLVHAEENVQLEGITSTGGLVDGGEMLGREGGVRVAKAIVSPGDLDHLGPGRDQPEDGRDIAIGQEAWRILRATGVAVLLGEGAEESAEIADRDCG